MIIHRDTQRYTIFEEETIHAGLKRIIEDIESQNLKIVNQFHSENPYHYFLLAEKAPQIVDAT